MIVVYRNQPSASADSLADALGCRRVRKSGTLQRLIQREGPDLKIISWGGEFEGERGEARLLNPLHHVSKFQQAALLQQGGIPTVELSRTPQRARTITLPRPPFEIHLTAPNETTLSEETARQLHAALGVYLETPPPTQEETSEWIPRAFDHVGGLDIIDPAQRPERPAFYSKKELFRVEYRIHSFLGRSIRAGIKVKRPEFEQLPLRSSWVRSWDGGWKMSYDAHSIKQRHRDLAHQACRALKLDFGAVDIGELADGTLKVIEVNRAPGIEGGTVESYVGAIQQLADGR